MNRKHFILNINNSSSHITPGYPGLGLAEAMRYIRASVLCVPIVPILMLQFSSHLVSASDQQGTCPVNCRPVKRYLKDDSKVWWVPPTSSLFLILWIKSNFYALNFIRIRKVQLSFYSLEQIKHLILFCCFSLSLSRELLTYLTKY